MGEGVELIGGPRCGEIVAWRYGDTMVVPLSPWSREKIHCVGWGANAIPERAPKVYVGRYLRSGAYAVWLGEDAT